MMKKWLKFYLGLVFNFACHQIIALIILIPFMIYFGIQMPTSQDIIYCVIGILSLLALVSAFVIYVNPELEEHEPYDWMK